MSQRELPGVALCCVDTANHRLALQAIERSRRDLHFARALFVTDSIPPGVPVPDGVDVVPIPRLASRDDYSRFVLKELARLITVPHVLLIQWDGFVANAQAWEDAFLDCDYLGAKWFWHEDGMRVGNGGFSLRSKRLLDALRDPRIELVDAEDTTICRTFRPLLEREFGIRFGSEELADRFSFEAAYPIGKPFGFHGLFNFCRVLPATEIADAVATFSDAIARSPQLLALLRNCQALGQWVAVAAIARRMTAAGAATPEVAQRLAEAESALAGPPVVGRNEPCPCGSGRRYKQCHGAFGATPPKPAAPPGPSADSITAAAMAAHQRGELDAAEAGYRDALRRTAGHPLASHYLGVVHYQRGDVAKALPLLEQAVAAVPREPEFHNNLGLALTAADRYADATASFGRAVALKPDHAIAWNNAGLAHQAANRIDDAIAAFRKAIALQPRFAEAHWNLACALLLAGEFREGWLEYEWRLAIPRFRGTMPGFDRPRWDGVIRQGTTLLLAAEQGLGDAIQFIRYARVLADSGMRAAAYVPAPLQPLFSRVPGVDAVFGPGDPLPEFDAWLPLLSLPGALGVADAASVQPPYLSAAAGPGSSDRRTVSGHRPLRIGVAWSGNPAHANDRRRSMKLAQLVPLLELAGTEFHSLQKGPAAREIQDLADPRTIGPLADDCALADTATLIESLDLVISVDTSIAHLAGALGKPIWVLLPFAPDWRWGLDRSDTPWYPTARLFRQPVPGDWGTVVAGVARALGALCLQPADSSKPG